MFLQRTLLSLGMRAFIISISLVAISFSQLYAQTTLEDKVYGMLIGSAIGDAAGGPIEFAPSAFSTWDDRNPIINQAWLDELGDRFTLPEYGRPIEPFGVWESPAPAGTITDDTRLKMIFFDALESSGNSITKQDFAHAMLHFEDQLPKNYHSINKEWLQEINYASKWVLGERDDAYPTERLWGGIPTVMGSMALIPVAALHPDDPLNAYKNAYELGYFDNGTGKDINAALIAGLSAALSDKSTWDSVKKAIRTTDPYNYNNTTYVRRATTYWLDKAESIASRAQGNPTTLYTLLEAELDTRYWWEAWVPLVVLFSIIDFSESLELEPSSESLMQLVLEFGHDSDSYAQVMGAYLGAMHGKNIFPENMINTVNEQMESQFGENIDDWMRILKSSM